MITSCDLLFLARKSRMTSVYTKIYHTFSNIFLSLHKAFNVCVSLLLSQRVRKQIWHR